MHDFNELSTSRVFAGLATQFIHEIIAHECPVKLIPPTQNPVGFTGHIEGSNSLIEPLFVARFYRHGIFRPAEGGGSSSFETYPGVSGELICNPSPARFGIGLDNCHEAIEVGVSARIASVPRFDDEDRQVGIELLKNGFSHLQEASHLDGALRIIFTEDPCSYLN